MSFALVTTLAVINASTVTVALLLPTLRRIETQLTGTQGVPRRSRDRLQTGGTRRDVQNDKMKGIR